MALSDEIRQQREKLKGKGAKAHLDYFWEYYKIPAAAVLIAVIFAVSLIRTFVTAKEQALGVMMLNASAFEWNYADEIADGFADYAQIDTQKYEVSADLNESLSLEGTQSQYDYATLEKIVSQEAAQQLDCFVADAYYFQYYCLNGMMADLREVMSSEELAQYEGRIFYVDQAQLDALDAAREDPDYRGVTVDAQEAQTYENVASFALPDPSEMEQPVPMGIVTTDSSYMETSLIYGDRANIAGIVVNSTHRETAAQFIRWLFQAQSAGPGES